MSNPTRDERIAVPVARMTDRAEARSHESMFRAISPTAWAVPGGGEHQPAIFEPLENRKLLAASIVETGGYVAFEAEDYTVLTSGTGSASGATWTNVGDSSASGGNRLKATPNVGINTKDDVNGPRNQYYIDFNTSGTYYAWVRMSGPNGSDDSVHVGLNGDVTSRGSLGLANESGSWTWQNKMKNGQRVTINVPSAGTHRFKLWMREDGVSIDSVVLTKDSGFVPSGLNGNGSGSGGGGGGGGTGGGGTSTGGDPNAVKPTPRITAVSSLSIPAGTSVHVNGLSSTFNSGDADTARFEWDFGDPNGRRNKLVGWTAAHLYDNPGTYTIRLKVYNQSLGYAETTATVNVSSSNRQKIYVSNSGSDSNSGSSESSPLRTFEKAIQRMKSNGGNTEILLQRGSTFSYTEPQVIDRSNVVVRAYGSGSKPKLNFTRARYDTKAMLVAGYNGSNVTIRDLAFDTPYSGDTSSNNMPHAIQPGGTNVTIVDNEFRHVGDAVSGNYAPKAVLVQNNTVPGTTMLRRYFTWIEGSDWTVLDNVAPNSTREHIVRIGNGTRLNISHNDIGNLDRRSQGDSYDYAKGVLNIQKGSYAHVGYNTTKGPSGVGPLGDGDGLSDTSARFRHAVFEGNRLNGYFVVEHGSEDVEIRNNILSSGQDMTFNVEGYNSSYGRGTRNIRIVNNTAINQASQGYFMRVWPQTEGLIVSNNLYHAPNLYAGPYGAAVVRIEAPDLNGFGKIDNNVWADADIMPWAGGLMWVGTGDGNTGYKDKGEWLAYSKVDDDVFSDVSIDGSFRPSSSSQAATAGDRQPGVMVDFYGAWRPNSDNRPAGAVTL